MRSHRAETFCNDVLGRASPARRPCAERYPPERYSQLNLAALDRLGTLEFRGFPATHDPQRALSWVHFVLSFVEAFKDDASAFDAEDAKRGTQALRRAQLAASVQQLEAEMRSAGFPADLTFLRSKAWIVGPACTVRSCDEACMVQRTERREQMLRGVERLPTAFVASLRSSPERSTLQRPAGGGSYRGSYFPGFGF